MAGHDELRLVLIGKSGHGKSSTGNKILGEDKFLVGSGPNFTINEPVAKMETIDRRTVKVFDTPGLRSLSDYPKFPGFQSAEYLTEVSPGPHAFVLVLNVEEFTQTEQGILRKLTESNLLTYTVVLFTHGNNLGDRTIEDFVRESAALSQLVNQCSVPCHVIDNELWNQEHEFRSNNVQVGRLLNTIETMAKNTGYYSDPELQRVEGRIQHEKNNLMNEYGYNEREARNGAKRNVLKYLKEGGDRVDGYLLLSIIGAVALAGVCFMKSD